MALKRHRVKFLVDQLTGQVVWLTYFYDTYAIPIFDQSLNIQKSNALTGLDVWQLYLDFKLYFNATQSVFYAAPSYTDEFKNQFPRIHLLRTKAMALDHISAGCEFLYEKYNTSYKGLHNVMSSGNIDSERWITFIQEEHKCTRDDVVKLINFKKEEWSNLEFMIEKTRYHAHNQMMAATTVEEAIDVYEQTCATLFYSARPSLLDLVALKKPF